MKHKILMLLTLFLMGIVLVSCEYKNKENLYDNETQQLQIFKSDLNLTQDQQMSRIKAEHLKKNKGYIDSDEVITILSLSEDALIDTYNNKYSGTVNTLAKYSSSIDGRNQAGIRTIQAKSSCKRSFPDQKNELPTKAYRKCCHKVGKYHCMQSTSGRRFVKGEIMRCRVGLHVDDRLFGSRIALQSKRR